MMALQLEISSLEDRLLFLSLDGAHSSEDRRVQAQQAPDDLMCRAAKTYTSILHYMKRRLCQDADLNA